MTILQILPKATSRDSVLLARSLPAFTGQEGDDLLCGKCGGTLAAGVRAQTLRREHPQGNRLIIRCVCKGYNIVVDALPRRRGHNMATRVRSDP